MFVTFYQRVVCKLSSLCQHKPQIRVCANPRKKNEHSTTDTRGRVLVCDLTVHCRFVYMYTYMHACLETTMNQFWTVLRIYNIIIMAYMKTTLRGLFTLIIWCVTLLTSRFNWTRMFTERIWRMKVHFFFIVHTLTKLEINIVMSTCLWGR